VNLQTLLQEVEGPGLEVALAQHLLVAADRFQLPRLRRICERRLCETVEVGGLGLCYVPSRSTVHAWCSLWRQGKSSTALGGETGKTAVHLIHKGSTPMGTTGPRSLSLATHGARSDDKVV